jgi:hypothetical protein
LLIYWGVYDYSLTLYIYAILHREEVLDYFKINNFDLKFLESIESQSFIDENKKGIGKFLERNNVKIRFSLDEINMINNVISTKITKVDNFDYIVFNLKDVDFLLENLDDLEGFLLESNMKLVSIDYQNKYNKLSNKIECQEDFDKLNFIVNKLCNANFLILKKDEEGSKSSLKDVSMFSFHVNLNYEDYFNMNTLLSMEIFEFNGIKVLYVDFD